MISFVANCKKCCWICPFLVRLLRIRKRIPFLFRNFSFVAGQLFEIVFCRNIFVAQGIYAFFLILKVVVMYLMVASQFFLFAFLVERNFQIFLGLLINSVMDFMVLIRLQRMITFFKKLFIILRPIFSLVILLGWGVETFKKVMEFYYKYLENFQNFPIQFHIYQNLN